MHEHSALQDRVRLSVGIWLSVSTDDQAWGVDHNLDLVVGSHELLYLMVDLTSERQVQNSLLDVVEATIRQQSVEFLVHLSYRSTITNLFWIGVVIDRRLVDAECRRGGGLD